MKIQQLKNFIEAIDCGSINKAAQKLYISQPNLSRSLHALEIEMGSPLFNRTNKGITLTPLGSSLYYYAHSILNQIQVIDRLKEISIDTLHSKLSVSVASIFLKDDLILDFYKGTRSADTEIQIYETTCEEVFSNVCDLKSELGILILNDLQLNVFKKMAELREIEIEILDHGSIFIHINTTHPLAHQTSLTSHELADYLYIHLPSDFFSNLNLSLNLDGIQLSDFPKTLTMSNYHSIIHMLKKTNSFLIGNKWQIDELQKTRIISLPLENVNLNNHLMIIKRKREILSTAAISFLDVFKKSVIM